MNIKLILAGILALAVLIFGFQNFQVVEIKFLFWKLEMSRAIMIFLVFILGLITGYTFKSLK
ncbi:MAG: DUF1049 domain-containing protein [Candidatus Dadabacteria bacterium]|nr:DUF1049 domain-containing protein [Candidatus Dadabacteria bacterium]NIQ16507.1 DUF1049 domain-containing protein [Candidatus Dadabacteria bacterium]